MATRTLVSNRVSVSGRSSQSNRLSSLGRFPNTPTGNPLSFGLQCKLFLDMTLSPLWQDVARTLPATADGDAIGSWDDLSGNGYHAQQATGANKPILKKAIQNGLDVARFDGSASFLSLLAASLGMLKNINSVTFIIVSKANLAVTSARAAFFATTNASGNGRLGSSRLTTNLIRAVSRRSDSGGNEFTDGGSYS